MKNIDYIFLSLKLINMMKILKYFEIKYNYYIKEIENIIDIMEKTKKEEYNKTYLFMIKGDLIKKKEKFENIKKKYIIRLFYLEIK